jgi:hypothetical protein
MLRHYLTDDGHPARLFKGGEPGFCLPSVAEAFRFGALWQDSAGSTPGAVGLTVGRVGFIAGRSSIASQTTATKRPLLTTDSKSIPLLRFDGLDDCLVTPSIDFSACDAVTVIVGVRKAVGTAGGIVMEHGSGPGRFALMAPFDSIGGGDNLHTDTQSPAYSGLYAIGTAVAGTVFAQVYVATAASRLGKLGTYTVNGNGRYPRSPTGTDLTGAFVFQNLALNIGQRNAATHPFNGDLYSLTVIGRRLSNAEMLNTSRWINQQMGGVY